MARIHQKGKMMGRTITRKQREDAIKKVAGWYQTCGESNGIRIEQWVDASLEAVGIDVEPEPILPGVTPGDWSCDSDLRGIVLSDGSKIATCYGASCDAQAANARVMAGSKKLVELNMEWLLKRRGQFKDMSPELQELVNHLADMGADVVEIIK